MDEETACRLAYNAHESAECRAIDAVRYSLDKESVEALTTLCDPSWRWETRSFLSETIIEQANEILNARLDQLLGVGFGL
jgi:hypothetical protein